MRRSLLLAAALILLGADPYPVRAQTPADPTPAGLRVFLDCQRCDFDHFRREVPVVDYVRDRQVSDVHVLITRENTGGGGTEHTLYFLGRAAMTGMADTLRYVSRQFDTDDEVRDGLTRALRVGLARYLAYTGGTDLLDVVFAEEPEEGSGRVTSAADDPWNLWVFRASVSGEIEGESRTEARAFDGSLSAGRTTEDLKIDFFLRGEYEKDEFELSDGEKLVSSARDLTFRATSVWSLGPHWSVGGSAASGASTNVNQNFFLRGGPAVEYSLFPYAESTRRQITALYEVGLAHYRYEERTLYGLLRETRPVQSLQVSADFQQPWGELFLSLEGANFLDDIEQHRVDLSANVEIRLFRGVNLDVRGSVARIKDQIYVSGEDIPDEEILLERRELGTDFEYSVDVGLSFTFGSVFNNVVNPRMFGRRGGGGGGGDFR